MKVFCIAIGNPLRGDDGVAHRVIAGIEPGEDLGVRAVMQLTPELAADVGDAARVIFLDADIRACEPVIEPIGSENLAGTPLLHSLGPGEVVWFARRLYGFTGQAYLCRIPVESFEGSALSVTAELSAADTLSLLREWLRLHQVYVDREEGKELGYVPGGAR